LGREVSADDVAQTFVNFAKAEKTTTAIVTVDGGKIATALREVLRGLFYSITLALRPPLIANGSN